MLNLESRNNVPLIVSIHIKGPHTHSRIISGIILDLRHSLLLADSKKRVCQFRRLNAATCSPMWLRAVLMYAQRDVSLLSENCL